MGKTVPSHAPRDVWTIHANKIPDGVPPVVRTGIMENSVVRLVSMEKSANFSVPQIAIHARRSISALSVKRATTDRRVLRNALQAVISIDARKKMALVTTVKVGSMVLSAAHLDLTVKTVPLNVPLDAQSVNLVRLALSVKVVTTDTPVPTSVLLAALKENVIFFPASAHSIVMPAIMGCIVAHFTRLEATVRLNALLIAKCVNQN